MVTAQVYSEVDAQVCESFHAFVHRSRVDRRASRRCIPHCVGPRRCCRRAPPPNAHPVTRSRGHPGASHAGRSRGRDRARTFPPRSSPCRCQRQCDCRDRIARRCANRAHRDLGARRAQSDAADRGSHCAPHHQAGCARAARCAALSERLAHRRFKEQRASAGAAARRNAGQGADREPRCAAARLAAAHTRSGRSGRH